jgi:CubicO group peptidase (beta-lactamase class C family)
LCYWLQPVGAFVVGEVMRIVLWLMIAVALAASTARADEGAFTRLDGTKLSAAEVDRTASDLMTAAHVPGLALALINDGQVAYVRGYGYRNVEEKLAMTTDTVMSGASLTKAAFAYMVMELVDQGVVDLDKSIAAYLTKPLPEAANYRDLADDPRWRKFTVRTLLSHTSGMPNWRRFNEGGKLNINFEPGARYAYSGEGIFLLQLIIEKVTGKQLGELMQARVFDRLGMTRTSMVWRQDFNSDFAVGYDEMGKALGHDQRDSADAAGSMDTTIKDYARLLTTLLNGKGLSGKARAEMLRPQIAIHSTQQFPTLASRTTQDNDAIELSYGLGWGLFKSPSYGWAYFKEGHDDGVNNYAVSFDRRKTALLVLTNSSNGEAMFKYLADRLLGETCLPWYWENYIPYDQLELVSAAALDRPHPPCGPVR